MPKPVPRGRPRSQKAKLAALKAARELLRERGMTGVTVEAIAQRAGIGKPTIYRYWPNAMAVVMSSLVDRDDEQSDEISETGLAGLRSQLTNISRILSSPEGKSIALLLAASDKDSELHKVFRNHFFLKGRRIARQRLEEALAHGEVREHTDIETALDAIFGPIYLRLFLGHEPIHAQFVDDALNMLMTGLLPSE